MADEGTFPLTIAGRDIVFKESSQGSLIALQRVLNRINMQYQAATDHRMRQDLATKLGATVLDVADSRFVDPADRDWVEEQLLMGKIDIKDLMPIFANGNVKEEPEADDAPPKKKTAAKRTPKAAPVKKTANAARARR